MLTRFIPNLIVLNVFLLVALASETSAESCPCKIHKASATGPAACQRAETEEHCTLTFAPTQSKDVAEIIKSNDTSKSVTQTLSPTLTPDAFVEFANLPAPDGWTPRQFVAFVGYMLAIGAASAPPAMRNYIDSLAKRLAEPFTDTKLLAAVHGAFVTRGTTAQNVRLGEIPAVVGHGCIEFAARANILMIARGSTNINTCRELKK